VTRFGLFLVGGLGSATTLYLGFNLHAYSWIWAFLALIPLLALSENSNSLGSACGLGLLAGFSFNFVELFWITNSIAGFTNLPQVLVTIIMGLLALYMALYLVLFCGLWHYLRNLATLKSPFAGVLSVLAMAATWILLEDLRSAFLGGFPWHPLGLTQIDNQFFNWLLPWGGVRLLSGLIVIGSTGLYLSADAILKKRGINALFYLFFTLGPLVGIALSTGGSTANLHRGEPTHVAATQTRVAVIQPNIPQKEKWLPENRTKIIEKMISMTRQSLQNKPDLIIWPEAALPLLLEKERALSERLQNLVKQENCSLMLGGPRYFASTPENKSDEIQKRLYNSIFLFTPDQPLQIYNKIKLVPYGEFTPLAKFFPFISKIVPGLNYSPGDTIHNFTMKELKIAPSVCFEGVFPSFTARFFGAGANILINLTNDAWFGDSPGPRQHLLNIRLRAMENRCYIIRCANTGISAIINPQGEVEQQLPLNQKGLLTSIVKLNSEATFFSRHPNLSTIAAAIIALLSLSVTFFCRHPRKERGIS